MDRARISELAHRNRPIAAPVASGRVRELVGKLNVPAGGRAVDLGCGAGEWLQELVAGHPGITGVGVDRAVPTSAAERADRRGIADRLRWVEDDVTEWGDGLFELVVCVGASHAFGRSADMLAALRRHLRPGGQALIGDTIWEDVPTAAALEALGAVPDDFSDLAGLVRSATESGFEPSYGHVSTVAEWDDYEFAWTGSLVDWALREAATDADRDEVLAAAREHRDGWLQGWRRQLGFATLVLDDVAGTPADADLR